MATNPSVPEPTEIAALVEHACEIVARWAERMDIAPPHVEVMDLIAQYGEGHRAATFAKEDGSPVIVVDPTAATHDRGLEAIIVHEMVHVKSMLEGADLEDEREWLTEQIALLLVDKFALESLSIVGENHMPASGQNGPTYLCRDEECARTFPHPVPAQHEYPSAAPKPDEVRELLEIWLDQSEITNPRYESVSAWLSRHPKEGAS